MISEEAALDEDGDKRQANLKALGGGSPSARRLIQTSSQLPQRKTGLVRHPRSFSLLDLLDDFSWLIAG